MSYISCMICFFVLFCFFIFTTDLAVNLPNVEVYPVPTIAVAILSQVCQILHIVVVIHLAFPEIKNKITWLIAMSCRSHILFSMRFVNFKQFYKALHRTHQIKGQYKLLCLKWLESEQPTGQHFLNLHMSLLWFCNFSLYKLTERDVCGYGSVPNSELWLRSISLRLCVH